MPENNNNQPQKRFFKERPKPGQTPPMDAAQEERQRAVHELKRTASSRRAARQTNDLVNKLASQHIIDVPVNKSVYNGDGGRQFSMPGNKNRANYVPIGNEPTLKIVPLGGLGEVGKNMMAIEYGQDIIVVDMGVHFPGESYPGINYMIPDITYLETNKNKIRGHVFTHGHLDHIAAVKHLLHRIPAPVYGSKFTLGLIERQMSEASDKYRPIYNALDPDKHERVKLGVFGIEFVRVNHSIPDSCAIAIDTPVGTILHTGDWRFENDPVDGKLTDKDTLKRLGDKGVLLLLSDSTRCEEPGHHSFGEKDIEKTFEDIMRREPGRMIVSAFSSQIHRIQSVINAALNTNRHVAFNGYSMISNVEVAIRLGNLKVPKGVIMRMEEIVHKPDQKVVIVCTGSQGEVNAVLARMASGDHKFIKVKNTDVVVFSSNPIPGNERAVMRTIDGLMREGPHIYEHRTRAIDECGPLHLGGHAFRDEQLEMLKLVRPKYFVPIHGEFHMLVRHAELAVKEGGMPRENAIVMDNGDVLELTAKGARKATRVTAGAIMVDNAGSEVSQVVLKDRLLMSSEGIFVVVLTIDKRTRQLLTSPDIISRGFIYLRDSEELVNNIRTYLRQKVGQYQGRGRDALDEFKRSLRDDVAHLLFESTRRTPIVIPVVNEVEQGQETKPAPAKQPAAPNQTL